MRILDQASIGEMGLIYWNVKTDYVIPEEDLEKMRQKSISNAINATIINHMYEPGKAIQDMSTAVQRGWNDANKQRDMIENGIESKNEMFLIGDPNTIERFKEIESDPNFRGWMNPYLIEQIKNLKTNI